MAGQPGGVQWLGLAVMERTSQRLAGGAGRLPAQQGCVAGTWSRLEFGPKPPTLLGGVGPNSIRRMERLKS